MRSENGTAGERQRQGKATGVLVAVLFGSFAGNLEAIIPNAGLADLVRALHSTYATATWILTLYILLFATMMPYWAV